MQFGNYIGLIHHLNQIKYEILTIRDRIIKNDISFDEVKKELFDWIIYYYGTDREHTKPMLQDWILQTLEAAKTSENVEFKEEIDAIEAIIKMLGDKK